MTDVSGTPLVTVVIPTHNRAHLLPRAVRSVTRQSYPRLEIVVVDDGSTDGTAGVLAGLAEPRLRVVSQSAQGAAAARNAGVGVAEGSLVAFLDSDDEVEEAWLMRMLAVVAGRADSVVACCGYTAVSGDRRVVTMPHQLRPAYGCVEGLFTKAGVYLMPTALFREVGGFDADLRSGQHSELALRLLRRRPSVEVRVVATPLVTIHIHEGPRIRSSAEARMLGAGLVVQKHAWLKSADPVMWADYHGVAGVAAASLGQGRRARRHFRAAMAAQPRNPRHYARWVASVLPRPLRGRWGQGVGGLGPQR